MTVAETKECIDCKMIDGIAHVTLNDAERGNPIDLNFCARFRSIAIDLASSRAARAVLISASGKYFSVGGDINMFLPDRARMPEIVRRTTADLNSAITCLMRLDAPIICAVQGPVAGGALGIIAMADFVFSNPHARFTPAFPMIGFSVDCGATITLPARIGYARAKQFLMLSDTISAQDAKDWGLVDKIFEENDLLAEAKKLAARFAKGPTRAYGGIKHTMTSARLRQIETALEDEANTIANLSLTDDAWEGMTAFSQRRTPQFQGR